MAGWDDPRMPTLAGLRRRGVTPEAIRAFADTIGVARSDARIELSTFEHAVRDDLNMRVPRVMAVSRPVKLVLTNYPEGPGETLDAPLYPHDVPKTGRARCRSRVSSGSTATTSWRSRRRSSSACHRGARFDCGTATW